MTLTDSAGDTKSFPAHPASLYDVREFIRARADEADLSGVIINDLVLAVSEACANAVLHSESSDIEITWECDDSSVRVEIRDEGLFKRRVPLPEFEDPHGHGIPLMIALVDEVVIREGSDRDPGTTVRLLKFRSG
jgi:serine/threonine-protein kinase RsbW